MPNYVLQEMSEEMGDGKKKVYPRMQTYSLHDFDTVIRHMRDYSGSFSEGTIRGVLDALVTTMKSWMPLGHNIKIDGLGVFSLSLGFDMSTPSEAEAAKKQKSGNADDEPKSKYRHVCISGINFKPDPQLLQQMNREATFERTETDIVVPRKVSDSRDERIRKALAIIDRRIHDPHRLCHSHQPKPLDGLQGPPPTRHRPHVRHHHARRSLTQGMDSAHKC